jgi:hypothetical protein
MRRSMHTANVHVAPLPPAIRIVVLYRSNGGNEALRVAPGSDVAYSWSAAVKPVCAEMTKVTGDVEVIVIGWVWSLRILGIQRRACKPP